MSSNWYAESGTALILNEKETIEFCKKYLKEICGRDMVKVPDAYTAFDELKTHALIRSKYKDKQVDLYPIKENDENYFEISTLTFSGLLYEDEMSGGLFYPFECDERCGEDNCFELYGDYYGIFFTDKSTLPQEIFKGTYHSMDEIIGEFKEKLEDYLPEDFNWKTHIGFIQYAIYA